MSPLLKKILVGLAIADLLSAIDSTAVNVALPRIASLFHIVPSQVSLVQVLYAAALITVLIPAGRVGDALGHRKIFLWGLGLFAGASFAIALSPSFLSLIIFRIVQGAAAGILYTSSGALIARHWEKTELAFGITASFFSIGLFLGPLLGGVLSSATILSIEGWHWIFAINLPLVGLSYLLLRKTLADDANRAPFSLSIPSLLLLVSGIAFLSASLPARIADRPALLGIGTALLIVFIIHENIAKKPLLQISLFHSQTFAAISVFTAVAMFCLISLSLISSFYLQDVAGLSPLRAGLSLLPLSVGMAVFAGLAGAFHNWKIGSISASFLIIIGLLLLSRSYPDGSYWQSLFPGYLAVSAGGGLMMTNTFAAALGSTSEESSGVASGTVNSLQQLGSLAGVVFAASHDLLHDYRRLYVYLALIGTISLVAALFVRRPLPAQPPSHA